MASQYSRYGQNFAHPIFLEQTARQQHSRGNQPGFPNQFQYLNVQKIHDPTAGNREYVVPYINQDVEIGAQWREGPITGQYQAMVPDLPFSPQQEENNLVLRGLMGFVAIGLASMFFI